MNENFEETQPQAEEYPLTQERYLKEIRKQRIFGIKIAAIIILVIAFIAFIFYNKGLFIAAKVNGSFISRLAVIRELESVSGKNALDSLVAQKLINDEAKKKGVVVTKEEIDAEIKNIENQVKAQGLTFNEALASQGMSLNNLKKQITNQKKLEKILDGQIQVTDEEVDKYIKDNDVKIPKGEEDTYKNQIKEQIKQQNFTNAVNTLLESLKSQAKITYIINY